MPEQAATWIDRRAVPASLVETWFKRYGDDVSLYLRHLVGNDDDAADLTQDVFAAALRFIGSGGTPPTRELHWLIKIAHNRAIDHFRRKRLISLFVNYEDDGEMTSDVSDSVDLWIALEKLPISWREAVVLRYRWGMTSAEIAVVQRRSEGAVRAAIGRALKRLKRDLEVSR